jgi:HD-GYP domain-containing protein (c-di-GMP phosphodiesterase class II)
MENYIFSLYQRDLVKKERDFFKVIKQLSNTKHDLNNQEIENQKLVEGIVSALNNALEAKDPYTRGHSKRVSQMSWEIAKSLGLSPSKCEQVRLAGLFHDIGKIGISDCVLLKSGPLTNKEFQEIKQHPVLSFNILEPVDPFSKVLKGVLYHHENWDGSGYPEGLKGENIPLSASIIHVADSFDAMTSKRSYRNPMSSVKAMEEIKRMSGTYYCPEVVEHFCKIYAHVYQENKMA